MSSRCCILMFYICLSLPYQESHKKTTTQRARLGLTHSLHIFLCSTSAYPILIMLTIHQCTRRKKSIHPSTRTKNHSIHPRAKKSVYPCETKSLNPQEEEKIMHNWSFCRKLSSAFLCCLYNRLSLPSLRKDTCLLLFFLSTILIWNQPLF